jgi:SET domain-containing protein
MKLDSGVCVDAEFAERAEGVVRYVNHSLLRRNCELKALARPLFAGTVYLQTDFPIKAGDELLYNYGRAYWESYYKQNGWAAWDPRRLAIDLL